MKTFTIRISIILTFLIVSVSSITGATYYLNQSSGSFGVTGSSYVNSMSETWEITTGTNDLITLSYTINTEANYDFVYIYDINSSGTATLLTASGLSGTLSGTITTTSYTGKARVVFTSDGSVSNANGLNGFAISFYGASSSGGSSSVTGSGTTNSLAKWSGLSSLTTSTIYDNGNVGIGTVNPAYKLDVLGTIRAREVLVNLSGVPDYVFDESYVLPKLEQVQDFIQANKHLPEIPSAAEIEKHGVSVNDMQIKLLKKIEELTLYSIQQQKEIDALQEEFNKLKK